MELLSTLDLILILIIIVLAAICYHLYRKNITENSNWQEQEKKLRDKISELQNNLSNNANFHMILQNGAEINTTTENLKDPSFVNGIEVLSNILSTNAEQSDNNQHQ